MIRNLIAQAIYLSTFFAVGLGLSVLIGVLIIAVTLGVTSDQ